MHLLLPLALSLAPQAGPRIDLALRIDRPAGSPAHWGTVVVPAGGSERVNVRRVQKESGLGAALLKGLSAKADEKRLHLLAVEKSTGIVRRTRTFLVIFTQISFTSPRLFFSG